MYVYKWIRLYIYYKVHITKIYVCMYMYTLLLQIKENVSTRCYIISKQRNQINKGLPQI